MMSSIPHSTLEVAPNTELPEPQKFAYYAPELYVDSEIDTHKYPYNSDDPDLGQQETICGLRKSRFWILVVVAVVVVIAAVGGGIGGALASASSNKGSNAKTADTSQPDGVNALLSSFTSPSSSAAAAAAASSSLSLTASIGPSLLSSTTSTPTMEPKISVTATTIVGPTSTIVRDCPSSNDTLYDVTLGNTKMSFRKECGISIVGTGVNQNAVVKVVSSLDECIDLCAAYNINNRTRIAAGTDKVCNTVCWRNTFDKINDWPGGMCFGFAGQNTTDNTFKYKLPAETR